MSEMGRATLWAFGLLSLLGLYVHPACGQRFREDGKCGGNSLAPDGNPADCDHIEVRLIILMYNTIYLPKYLNMSATVLLLISVDRYPKHESSNFGNTYLG